MNDVISETHSDAEGFEDVHLAHGAGPVVQQPGVHAALMEQVSKDKHSFNY